MTLLDSGNRTDRSRTDVAGMAMREIEGTVGALGTQAAALKSYARPMLICHGKVSQLTAQKGGSNTDGFGGTFS